MRASITRARRLRRHISRTAWNLGSSNRVLLHGYQALRSGRTRPPRSLCMRIAQVAPLYEAVPPRLYGGTERVVAHLTDALVALGHDVTLFASAEARTSA